MTEVSQRILSTSLSDTDLQLVVGADDLKSIERDIDLFEANENSVQMIVTCPGRRLTGALRFGAGNYRIQIILFNGIIDSSAGNYYKYGTLFLKHFAKKFWMKEILLLVLT